MSSLSDFTGGGGGGLTPKFEEFNSAGTFTPTQALIDAGGYIELFLVGGGGRSGAASYGACGGETILTQMYLTSTTGCAVTIGAGGASNFAAGGSSTFAGSSAGGVDVTALGGLGYDNQDGKMGSGWGSFNNGSGGQAAGSGMFGYGAGGANENGSDSGGVKTPKANSGQGSLNGINGGSGYCLIKWYE